MKKILFTLGIVAVAFTSCGESSDSESEESNEKKGPSLCECVNIDEDKADEAMIEDCKNMEEKWKEEYKSASEEEREAMMDEIMACEEDAH